MDTKYEKDTARPRPVPTEEELIVNAGSPSTAGFSVFLFRSCLVLGGLATYFYVRSILAAG